MKQEDKDLLLKDLCARLPYGVWIDRKLKTCKDSAPSMLDGYDIIAIKRGEYDFYRPYLFPLSSLTEEQRKEYENTTIKDGILTVWTTNTYDWCNENHFDYRGLIPMGLANDVTATGLNIY